MRFALLLTALVGGGDAGCEHTGTTLHLTELNWEDEVVQGKKLLHFIEFSAPWCIWSPSHACDDMVEAWKVLGKEYEDHPFVQIAEVDCGRWAGIDENNYSIPNMCTIHQIKEYPTVRAFSPALGAHGVNYTGGADVAQLKRFVQSTVDMLCRLDGVAMEPTAACSAKERKFAEQWRAKPMDEVQVELRRMRGRLRERLGGSHEAAIGAGGVDGDADQSAEATRSRRSGERCRAEGRAVG